MPAQATVPLEKARRLEPEKASIREALGIAYFRITGWRAAEREFRKVLELSPVDDYAHYALGRASASRAGRGGVHPPQARPVPAAPAPGEPSLDAGELDAARLHGSSRSARRVV